MRSDKIPGTQAADSKFHIPNSLFPIRAGLFPHVKLIHCGSGPVVDQALQSIDGPLETRLENRHLILGDRF